MTVTVLYFAALKEALGVSSESLALSPGVATVADLRAHLAARGEAWAQLASFKNLRCAVNQDMVPLTAAVKEGDEVAFFPPVTGG
ncbi:molybdopterin (MPT) converting factor, subunit 1 [Oryzomicrobium terrae]|uniref:Molybdopterin synthase sulfur carrier subunit n=1 Tax=Oryzomicrobium terrae TaxID=1735038 RepID=A0A5C1E9E2_9RHOO|nr:molybdopterin converting factor subunit 1 [Oryzomicrobium terrae]QEL65500.1 molybdopterin (MPT) converting factor, subunit 1 [Oryzomicrobium terrae]